MKRPRFTQTAIYHVYNRGVEKRTIFKEDSDRFRFIHNMFEFNDTEPAANSYYKSYESYEIRSREPRKVLVKILAFCLMPNHFHLLLQQVREKGITEFMRKLCLGYAMYFNKKYERVGGLFQGRFKSVVIEKNAHLLCVPHYIHLNPLDITMPEWREGSVKNYKEALKLLENYRWSSYLDYIGIKNFPSVTDRGFMLDLFDGPINYRRDIAEWLYKAPLSVIGNKELILE